MVPMRKFSVIAVAMGAMALTACAHGGGSAQAYRSPGFHPFGGGAPRTGPVAARSWRTSWCEASNASGSSAASAAS